MSAWSLPGRAVVRSVFRATVGWVFLHPWAVLLPCAVLTAVLGVGLSRIELDVSIESFLEPDDPDILLVDEITKSFGSAVPLVVAYRDPDLFTARGLARLDALTRRIEGLPYVEAARSLTNVKLVTGDGDEVAVRPLVEPLPQTDAAAQALEATAVAHRSLRDNLVDRTGTVAAVVVTMVYIHGQDDDYAPEVVEAVAGAAREVLGADHEFHLAGLSVFYTQMLDYVRRDLAMLIGAPLVLVVGLLLLTMRSGPGTVLPLLVVLLTLVWILGLMGTLGYTLGVASVLLAPLLLVIGCADGVHILNQVAEERAARPDAEPRQIVIDAVERVGVAVFLTSATTAAGFGSLTVSHIRTISQFGLFAALAVGVALALSLLLLPALLAVWRLPPPTVRRVAGTTLTIEGALAVLGRINRLHPKAILLLWVVIVGVFAAGIPRVRIETGFRDNFWSTSPIARSLDFVQAHLAGADLLSLYPITEEPGGILEPEVLRFIARLSDELRRYPEVRQVESVADLLSDARHVLDPDTPPGTYVPRTRAEAAQLLLLFESEPELLAPMLTDERDRARIAARFDAIPTTRASEIIGAIQERAAELAPPGVTLRILGPLYLTQRLVHEIIDSQLQSFGLAFGLILVMLVLALRSARLGALGMIPNLTPIVIMLGVMGWLDIPLNDVTIMTASIAIGIAVDDTIHLLVRFRYEQGRGGPVHQVMSRTVASVGRAVVITSLVLAAGFATTTLGSFKPPVFFGLLSVVAIVAALAADLTLLPALLLLRAGGGTAAPAEVAPVEPPGAAAQGTGMGSARFS